MKQYVFSNTAHIKIKNNITNEILLETDRPVSTFNIRDVSINLTEEEVKILTDNMYKQYKMSLIPINPIKETIEVIYHGKETIVLIKDDKHYYKGVANCHYQDTYDKKIGFEIALERAREKQVKYIELKNKPIDKTLLLKMNLSEKDFKLLGNK
jgi:hypothetical protein